MKKKDKNLIEAVLFAASEPLDISSIKSKVKVGTDVLKILYELNMPQLLCRQNKKELQSIQILKHSMIS